MAEKTNLKNMEQKVNKLLSEDGLTELLLGIILFSSSASFSGTISFTPFLGIYVVFMNRIIEGFRNRFTYPRIGYVKLPDEDTKKIGVGILTFMGTIMLILAITLFIAYGRITGHRIYQWMPTVMGLMLFGGLNYGYSKSRDKVNIIYIIIALTSSIAFSLMNFTDTRLGLQLYLLSMSGVFIVAGVIRFYAFTRKYPIQTNVLEEGTQEDE
ncbi:hypothetical protein ACFL0D_07460 [Thermoproteota archaeon]